MEIFKDLLIEILTAFAKPVANDLWKLIKKLIKKSTSTSGKRNRGGKLE